MQWVKNKYTGFTIVELLIVIVVIAILAAITIVAYNGIQARANASAVQAATKQAYTKLETYAVENTEIYPTSLTTLGIVNPPDTTYTYQTNAPTAPTNFCLVATKQSTVYYTTSESSTPLEGSCANLVSNPSFEVDTAGWNGSSGNSFTRQPTGGAVGPGFGRTTYTTASTSAGGNWFPNLPIIIGKTYTGSMYVRSNQAMSIIVRLEWKNSSGGIVGAVASTANVLTPNTWTRLHTTGVVTPTNAASATITWQRSGGIDWPAGATLDFDGVQFTQTDSLTQYTE